MQYSKNFRYCFILCLSNYELLFVEIKLLKENRNFRFLHEILIIKVTKKILPSCVVVFFFKHPFF